MCVHSNTETNFSSFVCKSFQCPGMGSAHLCVPRQQVPIPIQSRCCCSDCAHPPSNLEVNPPQTSTGMCLCVCVCRFFCQFFHLCVSSLQFLMGNTRLPQPLTSCRPRSAEYGLWKSLGIKVPLWLPSSWIFLLESESVEWGRLKV